MTPITPPTEAAGLLRRVLALLIDWFASTVVALLAVGVGSYGSGSDALATLIVFVLEVVILTWLTGASFGQRILGLRVVAMDGGRVTFPRVLLRTLLICLVIPDLVMDSQGRGLHDRAAGSIVVRR